MSNLALRARNYRGESEVRHPMFFYHPSFIGHVESEKKVYDETCTKGLILRKPLFPVRIKYNYCIPRLIKLETIVLITV